MMLIAYLHVPAEIWSGGSESSAEARWPTAGLDSCPGIVCPMANSPQAGGSFLHLICRSDRSDSPP